MNRKGVAIGLYVVQIPGTFGSCGPVHRIKITSKMIGLKSAAFCLAGANTASLFEVRKVYSLGVFS